MGPGSLIRAVMRAMNLVPLPTNKKQRGEVKRQYKSVKTPDHTESIISLGDQTPDPCSMLNTTKWGQAGQIVLQMRLRGQLGQITIDVIDKGESLLEKLNVA